LDISEAFYTVWHAGLLKKLEAIGIRNHLLQWIDSYLKNRIENLRNRILMDNPLSGKKRVKGTPRIGARTYFISNLY
jgi:hypothetical protein